MKSFPENLAGNWEAELGEKASIGDHDPWSGANNTPESQI
jgi:hypothetical protein